MLKSAIILYFVVFGLYILFSRQPDYFDGEKTIATIHLIKDSMDNKLVPYATFSDGKTSYSVNAAYIFRKLQSGQRVDIIYERSQPEKAAVYSWWGYWFTWGEIIFSVVLLIAFYKISTAVTKNPSPETLIEQMEYKPQKRRKYED